MSGKSDSQAARRVKQTLASQFAGQSWFRGIAIVPDPAGHLAVRVSVATSEGAAARQVPDQVDGVPVHVLLIDGYQPRATSLRSGEQP